MSAIDRQDPAAVDGSVVTPRKRQPSPEYEDAGVATTVRVRPGKKRLTENISETEQAKPLSLHKEPPLSCIEPTSTEKPDKEDSASLRKQKRAETASPDLATALNPEPHPNSVYGRLTILGFRRQWQRVKGDVVEEDRNASITLCRRPIATGLIPSTAPSTIMSRGDCMQTGPGVFIYSDVNRAPPDARHTFEVPCFRVPLLPSPEFDRYQVGRNPRGNDFVVSGKTFEEWDELGSENGPVSRFAFRLICERETGKVRVYAGGFDEAEQLYIGPTAPRFHTVEKNATPSTSPVDALVTYGVLLYKPELQHWSEISVLYGNLYEPRRAAGVASRQIRHVYPVLEEVPAFDNVLTDGSIIVNGGTAFIWRTPGSMREREERCPPAAIDEFVRKLETEVGACPVTLEPMDFRSARGPASRNQSGPPSSTNPDTGGAGEKPVALASMMTRSKSGRSAAATSEEVTPGDPTTVNGEDGGVDEERIRRKPMVFTKCGHVFSDAMRQNHNKNEDLRCPSCRAVGPFRELLIVSVPDISDGLPTHVLHPCGHAIDSYGAKFWSKHIDIPKGAYEIAGPWGGQIEGMNTGACPFCAEVVLGQAKLYFP